MKNYLITLIVLTGIFNSCTSRSTAQPTDTDSLSSTTLFIDSLETLIDPTIEYDAKYRRLKNMCDDVPANIGACADVVVRAFSNIDVCLQQEIYNHRKSKNLSIDTNIDHRRVRNLGSYFEFKGWEISKEKKLQPGDIIWWKVNGSDHIGIVYHNGKMLHNEGRGQSVDVKPDYYPIYKVYRINA
tara:strand:+ start:520 stop:1074 length:555 start_codon:yes stop_codon:yes gene_type:complete